MPKRVPKAIHKVQPLPRSLPSTCYRFDCSTVNESGVLIYGSSRLDEARTRLDSALFYHPQTSSYAMFLARITFGADGGATSDRDALKDAAEGYLAALLKNGQICGDYLTAWSSATH